MFRESIFCKSETIISQNISERDRWANRIEIFMREHYLFHNIPPMEMLGYLPKDIKDVTTAHANVMEMSNFVVNTDMLKHGQGDEEIVMREHAFTARYLVLPEIAELKYYQLCKKTKETVTCEMFKFYALYLLHIRLRNHNEEILVARGLSEYLQAIGPYVNQGIKYIPIIPKCVSADECDGRSDLKVEYQIRNLETQLLRVLASFHDYPDAWFNDVVNGYGTCIVPLIHYYGYEPIVKSDGAIKAAQQFDFPEGEIKQWTHQEVVQYSLYSVVDKTIRLYEQTDVVTGNGTECQRIISVPYHTYNDNQLTTKVSVMFNDPRQITEAAKALAFGFQELRLPILDSNVQKEDAMVTCVLATADVLLMWERERLKNFVSEANWCVSKDIANCATRSRNVHEFRKEFIDTTRNNIIIT